MSGRRGGKILNDFRFLNVRNTLRPVFKPQQRPTLHGSGSDCHSVLIRLLHEVRNSAKDQRAKGVEEMSRGHRIVSKELTRRRRCRGTCSAQEVFQDSIPSDITQGTMHNHSRFHDQSTNQSKTNHYCKFHLKGIKTHPAHPYRHPRSPGNVDWC